MDEVIAAWSAACKPIQTEIEAISFITRAKHPPPNMNDRKPSVPGPPSNGFRRTPTGLIPSSNNIAQPRSLRIPSGGPPQQNRDPSPQPSPSSYKRPDYLAPTDFTTATVLGGASIDRTMSRSPGHSPNSRGPGGRDYFTSRQTSSANDLSTSPTPHSGALTPYSNGFVKKKPPPPPPPKRIQSAKPEQWVVALYAFTGQGDGDLSFKEGDRIKIVKKTDTDQDWWVGELNGRRGSFPANYCKST